ncbi:hypothetical protein UFOVP431_46 [uncultured Caudovirales phage]|uniref:Uncharacterized protein n=1 Tax=uncultured Caudovirales phage TaxID=2100421 RepID=A0A6J5MN11_9CAUD|nr:hypothetical protein UFOVP431_46 [uncultured Caudovirales phage]
MKPSVPEVSVATRIYDPASLSVAARIEQNDPAAYRLIRRKDKSGSMVPLLQALFLWSQGSHRGGEWRDLETQDDPDIRDDVPFSGFFLNS